MKSRIVRFKIILGIFCLIILLTSSPTNGEISSFQSHVVTSESDIDGVPTKGSYTGGYTNTNTAEGTNQVLTEENLGNNTQDWLYYKDLYLDSTQIDTDLQNFPLLVSLYDSDLKTKAQPDGDDIAFFSDAGTKLSHQIQRYDPNYSGSQAYLLAWVKTDLYANVDTRIEMRYGNSTMGSQQDIVNTWQEYNHVYHLDEDPSTTAPQVLDSTTTIDGTSFGSMTSTDLVQGKIDNSLDFDGADDKIELGNLNSNSWTGTSLSMWFYNSQSAPQYTRLFAYETSVQTVDAIMTLVINNGGLDNRDISARIATDTTGPVTVSTPASSFGLNQWHHVATTWDATSETISIYIDGNFVTSGSLTGNTIMDVSTTKATIADTSAVDSRNFPGRIDEVRVSQNAKTAAWYKAEYINQNDPTNFITVSAEKIFDFSDPIDVETDLDGSISVGKQSNFGDLRATDTQYNTMQEQGGSINTKSIGSSGTGSMRIGNGNVDWGSSQGTISFWFYMNNVPSGIERLWGMSDNMEIRTNGADTLIDVDFGISDVVTTPALSTGKWYYLSVVWDDSADTLSLYVGDLNIFPIYTQSVGWTYSLTTESPVLPEGNQFLNSRNTIAYLDGKGDELRYYDRTLSQSELSNSYNQTLIGNEEGLVSYYPFDDTSYTDYGPAGNDGTPIDTIGFDTNIPAINQGEAVFDWEAKFVDIPYLESGVDLSIKTGTMGAENLKLQYWTGSDWATLLSSLTASSWNNISVNSYVNSNEFTIRLLDTQRSADTTVDTWNIDSIFLVYRDHVLEWEHTIAGVDTNREFYNLSILGRSSASTEDYDVQLWDSISGSWSTPLTTITSNLMWYNSSVTNSDLVASTMSVRYLDTNRTKDYEQDNLQLDYVAVESYDISPVLTSSPGTITYDEGISTYITTWQASDDNPGQYSIYLDEVLVKSNSWNSSTETVSYDIGGLVRGPHNLTIVFDDAYSGQTVYQNTVTVNDVTEPVFSNIPSDFQINEQTTSWQLSWTATDLHNSSYELYRNEILNTTGNWEDGTAIVIDRGAHEKGMYNYTLVVYDDSGNSASDTVYVDVLDETAPAITPSGTTDYNYEHGTVNIINWEATDKYADNYVVYANGTQINASTWVSGNPIRQNITGLAIGNYNYTIFVFDSSGNMVKSSIIVHVRDTTPASVSSPSDIVYEENDPGTHEIIWSLNDLNPNTLTIYQNGSKLFSAPWGNGDFSFDVSDLAYGGYNYTIVVDDDYGNSISDTVMVGVTDTINPEFTSTPSNTTITENGINNEISWIVSDNNPSTYTLYQNKSTIDTAFWSNGETISWPIDYLLKGTYNFTLIIFDDSGNQQISTVWITVIDQTNPEFSDTPTDLSYYWGSTSQTVSWTVTDSYDANYTIYKDGTLYATGVWTSGIPVTEGVSGLDLGTYNFTIIVQDESGNTASDAVFVSVYDDVSPQITDNLSTYQYFEGNISNTLNWTATENLEGTYRILQNGSQVVGPTAWTSGLKVSYNIDGLLLGNYNFTIIFSDTSGNTNSSTTIVTILDGNHPILDQPADQTNAEGDTGYSITWTISDVHPDRMIIYRNGSIIVSNSWTSGSTSINIDGLSVGTYNYTIFINDTSGNTKADTVFVTIYDNTNPGLNQPADSFVPQGELGNEIAWVATDLHPDTYFIYQNGTLNQTGSWISGADIRFNLDGLTAGPYNFTIVVVDQAGNQAKDIMIVIVTAESVFTNTPADIDYVFNTVDNTISWTVNDIDPDKYIIYQNGSNVTSGTWQSGVPIIYDIDGLAIGTYNFTIFVNDTNGNTITDLAYVTVSDMPDPVKMQNTITDYSEGSTGNTLQWNTTDMYPDTYVVYLIDNNTIIDSGSWNNAFNITVNIDGLTLGTYNFTIYINDTSGNTISHSVEVTVIDTTDPVFTETQTDYTTTEAETTNWLNWTVTDLHAANYTIYRLDGSTNTTVATGDWMSDQEIGYNFNGLSKGIYTFYILIQDTSNNTLSRSVQVTIIDATNPVITEPIDTTGTTFAEGSTGNWINATAFDKYNSTYEIYIGLSSYTLTTANYSGIWNNTQAISLNLDNLLWGEYNYTIVFTDESGNQDIYYVMITVTDETAPVIDEPVSITAPTFSEISSGNWINVTASDNYNATYAIYIGLETYTVTTANYTGIWNISEAVSLNLDNLDKGIYNYTIVFTDQSGNTDIYYHQITVTDETAPTVDPIETTGTTFNETSTGNWINVTASDSYADRYEIYIGLESYTLSAFNETGTWVSGQTFAYNLDNLLKGNYNLTIVFIDQSGNSLVVYRPLTVLDEKNPTIAGSELPSSSFSEASSNNWINVTASDAYNSSYEIYLGLSSYTLTTANYSGNWNSYQSVNFNLDFLTIGSYNYTIVFIDEDGNTNKVEFLFTVTDETIPSISPVSTTGTILNETSTGNWVNVTAYDLYNASYEIYIGLSSYTLTSANYSGIWNNSDAVSLSLDDLELGIYNYTIVFTDTNGNTNRTHLVITVIDETAPSLGTIEEPTQYFTESSTNNWLNVTASDAHNATYAIYVGLDQYSLTSANYSGPWNSGSAVPLSLDTMMKGTYNYTIVFTDSSGNTLIYQTSFEVTDETSPSVNDVGDILNYEEGSTGNLISWTVSDNHPSHYEIYQNNTLQVTGNWTGNIDYNIDGLAKGYYIFEIRVFDSSGNMAFDFVDVTVIDVTNPDLTDADDLVMNEGDTGLFIEWTGYDLYPGMYQIEIIGAPNVPLTSWNNTTPITYSLDGLTKGVYTFNITIFDLSGNYNSSQVTLTVVDNAAPTITNFVGSLEYAEGSTGNYINWTATDEYANNYVVNISLSETNIVTLQSGSWTSGTPINVTVDGYSLGQYIVTIYIYDQDGNVVMSSKILTVIDDTKPEILQEQADVSIIEGDPIILNWTVSDAYNATYRYYVDGVESSNSGTWNSTEQFSLVLDQTEIPRIGEYNITVFFYDSSLNYVSRNITLTILDITPPSLDGPSDFSITRGSTGNVLTWNATDDYPGIYRLYQNGSIIVQASLWNSDSNITFPIDNLVLGTHNFTIVVFDSTGNQTQMQTWVTVNDFDIPELVNNPSNQTISEGDTGHAITWIYTDASPATYTIYLNSSQGLQVVRSSTAWNDGVPITYSLNGLTKGIYNFTILIYDGANNYNTSTVFIFVEDTTAPTIITAPPSSVEYEEESSGNFLSWSMEDNYEGDLTLYRNGTLVDAGSWTSNDIQTYNIDGLAYGVYNYTLFLTDASGNEVNSTIIVTVTDVVNPAITENPSKPTYIEGTTGYDLSWTVEDLNPSSYNLWINNELFATGLWNSGQPILIDIDGLSYGTYNYSLTVFDKEGNNVTTFVVFDVLDQKVPVISSTQSDTTVLLGSTGNSVEWKATDLHPETYSIFLEGQFVISKTWSSNDQISFNVDGYPVGYYNITIYIYDEAGNEVSSSFTLRVKDPTVTDTNRPDFVPIEYVYEGDIETINGFYQDINGEAVSDTQITVVLTFEGDEVLSYQTETGTDGSYTIELDYTDRDPGRYIWHFSFTTDNYQDWEEITHEVKVLPHSYSIELSANEELKQGEKFYIGATVYYNNQRNSSAGLGLSSLEGRTGKAEGVPIEFEIVVFYEEGNFIEYTGLTNSTDRDGSVVVFLTETQTQRASRVGSITAMIQSSLRHQSADAAFAEDELPNIVPGDPDPITVVIQFFTQNVYLLAIIVGGILAFIGGVIYLRQRELRRIQELNNSIKQSYDEVRALESIKAVIIQTKSKVSLYEQTLNTDNLNTGLVGGMVSAFSSFLNEIGRNEGEAGFGLETMQRGDVSLTIHRGLKSNFILISEIKLPFVMLGQIQHSQRAIEDKFSSELQNSEEGAKHLDRKEVDSLLVNAGFKIDLLKPLKLDLDKIRLILRERSISRAIKSNVELLVEFPETEHFRGGGFTISDIIEFYKSRGVSRKMSSRIIVGAYEFDILQAREE